MIDWDYIVWAAAIAGGVYFAVSFPGRILPDEEREHVALWLTEREEERWARQFGLFFDALLGAKHFSLKRLVRSTIGSMIAVGALWLLFGPVLGLLGQRTDGILSVTELLVFALLINIAADYFSLMETRWLLRKFEDVRAWPAQVLLLLVDLVLSGAIIVVAITLFRLVRGEPLLHPIEMAAAYTPFAIFFYSTFLTSIWAWAFCLSAWFVRLFTRLGLGRWMDVYNRPFTQMGIVAAGLVFLGLLGGKPLSELVLPDDFDGYICQEYGGVLCTHASRLTEDEAESLRRLGLACQTGDPAQCRRAIDELSDRLSAEAQPFLKAACEDADDFAACTSLGRMHQKALGVPQDYARALARYERACEGGNMSGCNSLGHMHHNALGVPQDYARALALYERACEGGNMIGCNNLGAMHGTARGVPQDTARALALFERACEGGGMRGCNALGTMHYGALGVPQDYARALALYERACEGGEMAGCTNLGYMHHNALGVPQDYARALALYERACEGGSDIACRNLEALPAQ